MEARVMTFVAHCYNTFWTGMTDLLVTYSSDGAPPALSGAPQQDQPRDSSELLQGRLPRGGRPHKELRARGGGAGGLGRHGEVLEQPALPSAQALPGRRLAAGLRVLRRHVHAVLGEHVQQAAPQRRQIAPQLADGVLRGGGHLVDALRRRHVAPHQRAHHGVVPPEQVAVDLRGAALLVHLRGHACRLLSTKRGLRTRARNGDLEHEHEMGN